MKQIRRQVCSNFLCKMAAQILYINGANDANHYLLHLHLFMDLFMDLFYFWRAI